MKAQEAVFFLHSAEHFFEALHARGEARLGPRNLREEAVHLLFGGVELLDELVLGDLHAVDEAPDYGNLGAAIRQSAEVKRFGCQNHLVQLGARLVEIGAAYLFKQRVRIARRMLGDIAAELGDPLVIPAAETV